MRLAGHPRVHHVRPLLEHVAPLLGVLGAIVRPARGLAPFVRQRFFDPVSVESDFVENCRTRSPQVMHGEGIQRQFLGLGHFGDLRRDTVQRARGNMNVSVVARWKYVRGAASHKLQGGEDLQRLTGEVDVVRAPRLHAFLRNCPDAFVEIDFDPCRLGELTLTYERQQDYPQRQTVDMGERHLVDQGESNADFFRHERALAWLEHGDGSGRNLVGGILDFVPVKVREVVDALDDVSDVDRRRG